MAYTGETIDVDATLQRLNKAASERGFDCFSLVEQDGTVVPYFTRAAKTESAPRIYLSAGMHGDEPASPLSVLDLLENDLLGMGVDWTIFPMLNPAGFRINQRENHQGVDLNREYKAPTTKEVKAHVEVIEQSEPWDLALIIHEDWESEGYYLYDLPTELTDGWAPRIIEAVSRVCPIDLSDSIDEMSAKGGIIAPRLEDIDTEPKLMGHWPEPIFMHAEGKIRGTYTFESPSSFDFTTRIQAHNAAILASVELLLGSKR
ncbi:MAG: M14 family metallocarboxypeptidase [Opitutales bacterium]|jgi:predicted deacylase|nr:M14 family metallocarboxypeptidase [Opitutales bacterium]